MILNRTRCSDRHIEGFTLFETLVATMILAIGIVIVMQLFSGGLRSQKMSAHYSRAVFHGREKLEELLTFNELKEGEYSGKFGDGFSWFAQIFYVVPDPGRQRMKDLFTITVDIGWIEGAQEKHFTISTLRIAKRIAADK